MASGTAGRALVAHIRLSQMEFDMTNVIRPLIAGNWKMNGLKASAGELGQMMVGVGDLWRKVDLLICPPSTRVSTFAVDARGSHVGIGAQDCHPEWSGTQ